MENMLYKALASLNINQTAAGTTELEGAAIDMSGFDEVTFLAVLGSVSSGGTDVLKAQESADGSTGWADITGATSGTQTDKSNKILAVSVYRPRKRYVRAVLTPAVANTVVGGVVAFQTQGRKEPVTQPSSVAAAVTVAAS